MQDFIVLGIIPGTNIQLDFSDWVLITLSLILTYILVSYIARHAHKVKEVIEPLVAINTTTALIGPLTIDEVAL